MTDEAADASNEEQVNICIRWVDADLQRHEEFISLKPIARYNVEEIVDEIKVKQTIQIKVLF